MKFAGLCSAAVLATLIAAPPVQAQKQVVVYSANENTLDQLVFQAFEKATSIKVQGVSGGSGVLIKRVQTEKDRPQGDIIWGVSRSLLESNKAFFAAYKSKNVGAIAAEFRDPSDLWIGNNLHILVILQNTKMLPADQGPKSWGDLLDPKWKGKIVKGHPSYSGTILTATFQISRDLGWPFFEKLAQQQVMQVQSATEPPKKIALGERMVMADGTEYNLLQLKEKGEPVEIVYATEGTPLVVGPSAILKDAPNPNAARLFQHFLFSLECQQLIVNDGALRSFHPDVKEKAGRTPLKSIKLMKEDPAAVEKQVEQLKAQYTKLFKV